MKIHKIKDMTKGWFIGNFEPSLYKTNKVEVALKEYLAGDREPLHHHKVATEWTLVVSGVVSFNDKKMYEGDIVEVSPGESVEFRCLEDSKTVVVKSESVKGDKYES